VKQSSELEAFAMWRRVREMEPSQRIGAKYKETSEGGLAVSLVLC
jgi:hypothetical protein